MESPLSELAKFDDLRRCFAVLFDGSAEEAFLFFARQLEDVRVQWQAAVDSNLRLQREVESALKCMGDLESKLQNARKLLEIENKARREAEHERDQLEKKLYMVKDLLGSDHNLKDETRSKLDFLNKMNNKKRKSAHFSMLDEQQISQMDVNSTGSILSDLSLTRSENDFLDRKSVDKRRWKRSKSLAKDGTPRKSTQKLIHQTGNEKIVAISKVTVPQDDGPILAESCIEAIPHDTEIYKTPRRSPPKRKMPAPSAPPLQQVDVSASRGRPHNFEEKTIYMRQPCNHCQKAMKFGTVGLRCKNCFIQCHAGVCSKELDIVCAPQSAQKQVQFGKLSDYVTPYKPMIPALLIHCVTEIEKRGLTEKGLYRVNGSDRDVKALKEKFLRHKTVPCLKEIDINVLCGCVKNFLRSLQDKLLPDEYWTSFSNAVSQKQADDVEKSLKQIILSLPEANRDTLAFMMSHLQKIAEVPEVQMPRDSLAKVFAPTLIGSIATPNHDENRFLVDAYIQVEILRHFLSFSYQYWNQFMSSTNSGSSQAATGSSDDQFMAPGGASAANKQLFDTSSIFQNLKRKKKFYDTPPAISKQRK